MAAVELHKMKRNAPSNFLCEARSA